jgi:hypothetical protein
VPTPPAVTATPPPGYIYGGHDFDGWRYTYSALPNEGELWAEVHYDTQSVAALREYVALNRGLADQLAQTGGGARVDITFRTYLTPDQFRTWMQAHNLYAAWSGLRVLNAQGQRADLVLPWIYQDPLPQRLLDYWLTPANATPPPVYGLELPHGDPREIGGPFTLRGVFYVTAMVDAAQLPTLAADPLVYLADVTPNAVRADLLGQGVNIMSPYMSWVRVLPVSPFWQMEDFGLEQFR